MPLNENIAQSGVADCAGCQRECCHSADRVYDTRATGSVGTEHRASELDIPDTELRIPGISGRWVRVHAEIRRQQSDGRLPSGISHLAWFGTRGIRHMTSYETNLERSSALSALLTFIRQGDKADSHPKEEGGPSHEDIEL
jgi:hypothetical protein